MPGLVKAIVLVFGVLGFPLLVQAQPVQPTVASVFQAKVLMKNLTARISHEFSLPLDIRFDADKFTNPSLHGGYVINSFKVSFDRGVRYQSILGMLLLFVIFICFKIYIIILNIQFKRNDQNILKDIYN